MPRNLFVESLLHSRKRYWRRGLAFMMLFAMSVSFFTFSCSPPAQGAQVAASTSTSSAATPTHTVTWDRYSLKLDGKRLMVWSGEFHYWRLPSPALWSDVLQKIKAAGFNTISIYFDWAYHSPKAGVYDFTGIRDVSKLLTIAQDAGLYVIARPGPYINAETDAGGFPGWLITQKGRARSSASDYTAAYMEWLSHIDPILAQHQITNGGNIILYQVENEYTYGTLDATYMQQLEKKVRADGITVPLDHNDASLRVIGHRVRVQARLICMALIAIRRASIAQILHTGQVFHNLRRMRVKLLRIHRSSLQSFRVARLIPGVVLAMQSVSNSRERILSTSSTKRCCPRV